MMASANTIRLLAEMHTSPGLLSLQRHTHPWLQHEGMEEVLEDAFYSMYAV